MSDINQSGWKVTTLTTGPGRMFRNPRYRYLADIPPLGSGVNQQILTDWLNEKSDDHWTFICVNGNGQYIFYQDEAGKPIKQT